MSVRDQYAREIIRRHHKKLTGPDGPWSDGLPRARKPVSRGPKEPAIIHVGIIGAGAAGLYAALMLDSLEDPSITYEVLDADPMKDRKGGGRLFTYRFSESPNDYFVSLVTISFREIAITYDGPRMSALCVFPTYHSCSVFST